MDTTLDRFRRGDPDAVREVYRRYAGAVNTVARSIVRDRELAADVVQQTFVKAWRAAATFDGDRELGPWLYSIARRTAIDALRSESRPNRGGHEPEIDAGVTVMSFERTWEIHEVRSAIDDLPPDEREVVRRSHLLGYTHEQIADQLGVPIGTVKSRSNRAHRRLVAALAHLLPEAGASPPSSPAPGSAPAPAANRTGPAAVQRIEDPR
jgi:RNA polymerase sigma-70 factor (ECF subfamily)